VDRQAVNQVKDAATEIKLHTLWGRMRMQRDGCGAWGSRVTQNSIKGKAAQEIR